MGKRCNVKIAICDDEIDALETAYHMLVQFAKLHPDTDISIRRFQSAYDLLECVAANLRFDVYILDIMMPLMNGIEVGQQIRQKDEEATIIYLTASEEFALSAYRVHAMQYLIKPLDQGLLHAALLRVMERLDKDETTRMPIRTKDGIASVRIHQIVSVEYRDHTLRFMLADGRTIDTLSSREPFETTSRQLLKDGRFVKPHVAFVVNLFYVDSITERDFVLENGGIIPISQRNYRDMKRLYIDYLLKGGVDEA